MCGAQTAGLSQLLTAVPVYVRVALVLHDCCRARPYSHFTFGVSFVGSFWLTLYCMRRVGQPSRTLTDVPVELCVRHVRCVVPSFRTQTVALRSVCGSNPKAVTPRRDNIRVTCTARTDGWVVSTPNCRARMRVALVLNDRCPVVTRVLRSRTLTPRYHRRLFLL